MIKFLNTKQAATYVTTKYGIPLKGSTLEVFRCHGKGPRYRKVNGRIFYTEEDLDLHFVENARVIETCDSIKV